MSMRAQAMELWVLAAVLGLGVAGCTVFGGDTINAPSASGGNASQTQGSGSTPTTTLAPQAGAPHEVRVGQFSDERCPSGIQPASDVRTVRVGCVQPITCTPLLVGNVDAVIPLGLTAPDSFAISAGSAGTLERTEEPFNGDFRAGPTTGPVTITCTVRGKSGVLDLVVIQ